MKDGKSETRLWQHRVASSPAVATWTSFAAKALTVFCLPPFLFQHLTASEAALWFVFITLQGLQLLLSTALGATTVRAFGYAMGGATQLLDLRHRGPLSSSGTSNIALLRQIWLSMRAVYAVIAVLTLCVLSALGALSAPGLISQLEAPVDGSTALAIFLTGAALRTFGGLQISYLQGVGRIALLRWWEALFWGLAFGFALATLLSGGGLVEVTFAYQSPLIANLALNAWLARKDLRERTSLGHTATTDGSVFRQLWPAMWRSGIGIGAYLGATQGAGLYFARVGDTTEVASYLFAMSLFRPMMQFAQVPFFTKLPELARLQATGNHAKQVTLAERGMIFSNLLLMTMILAAGLTLPLIANISGNPAAVVPALLWGTIGLAAMLERIGAMHLQLYTQTNHIILHWANGGAALLFLGFSWLFLPIFDALSFPAAMCVALVTFYTPYSMWHSYRAFKLPFPWFEFKTSVFPLLLTGAFFIFAVEGYIS